MLLMLLRTADSLLTAGSNLLSRDLPQGLAGQPRHRLLSTQLADEQACKQGYRVPKKSTRPTLSRPAKTNRTFAGWVAENSDTAHRQTVSVFLTIHHTPQSSTSPVNVDLDNPVSSPGRLTDCHRRPANLTNLSLRHSTRKIARCTKPQAKESSDIATAASAVVITTVSSRGLSSDRCQHYKVQRSDSVSLSDLPVADPLRLL